MSNNNTAREAPDRAEVAQPALEIRSMAFDVTLLDAVANPNLWHLTLDHVGAANFVNAWKYSDNSRLANVTVSIVDEGVNYLHADLVRNYNATIDYDPRDVGENDAMPDTAAQMHGTRVAGLIGGDITNNIGTVGGGIGTEITGSYLRFGERIDLLPELAQVLHQQKFYDVSNNSWGFTQAFADNFSTSTFARVKNALQTAVSEGRDGLGTVMVMAAGNGKLVTSAGNIGDDSNFHNLSNSRFVIAVGAHDANGTPASFSSPGTNVLLTAPGVGLLTTSGGTAGSQAVAYVSGTSFSAPLVASTVALMLAENPDLGYRDVQEILVLSATSRLDGHSAENGFGHFNGGGLMFDREGGFGLLDAGAATALARNWTATSTLGNEEVLSLSLGSSRITDTHGYLEATLLNTGEKGFSADWIEIDLTLLDTNLDDLRIDLISPDGTHSVIADNMTVVGNKTYLNFTFSSVASWGEDPFGTWRIEFSHADPNVNLSVYKADVRIFGDSITSDDTYYFSSSYAALAASDGARQHIADSNGGTDTLNFAAGSSPVHVDLSGRTASSFQGLDVFLQGAFENVIGTTADDVLVGSAAANRLVGDYGNDLLDGGTGDDTLLGGAGDDIIIAGAGSDTIDGGVGADTLVLGKGWAAYGITYDAASSAYFIADGADLKTVKSIEAIRFAGLQVDLVNNALAVVSDRGPAITHVSSSTVADSGSEISVASNAAVGDVIATVDATDPNLVAGDNLHFELLTESGAPLTGGFAIQKVGSSSATITVSELVAADANLMIRVTDLAGHSATSMISVRVVEPAPQGQDESSQNSARPVVVTSSDGIYHVTDPLDLVVPSSGHGPGAETIVSHANWFWDVFSVGERMIIAADAEDSAGVGTTAIGSIFSNEMIGNAGTNVLFGRGGSDIYRAGDGIDFISLSTLGLTDDNAYGGVDGANTIVVDPRQSGATSYDIVYEFESGKDKIDLSAYGYASVDEVFAHGANDGLGNSYFALGDGFDYVYMVGLTKEQIATGDFLL